MNLRTFPPRKLDKSLDPRARRVAFASGQFNLILLLIRLPENKFTLLKLSAST